MFHVKHEPFDHQFGIRVSAGVAGCGSSVDLVMASVCLSMKLPHEYQTVHLCLHWTNVSRGTLKWLNSIEEMFHVEHQQGVDNGTLSQPLFHILVSSRGADQPAAFSRGVLIMRVGSEIPSTVR